MAPASPSDPLALGRVPWPGPRLAAAAGLIGPAYLGGTILALTLRQGAFLRSLGWDPLRAPTLDWPSGLALSPDGPCADRR